MLIADLLSATLGGASPDASASSPLIGAEMLVAACVLLALVAIAAIANVSIARRQNRDAARLARSRAKSMSELLRMIRIAESIAGIGIWQYEPSTGAQQWSEGLKRLFGVEEGEAFVEGDAETLLFASSIDLTGKVAECSDKTDPYSLRFDMNGFDGILRTISVDACNLMDGSGAVQRVVAVVRDVTEQVERERELVSARRAAMNEAHHARKLAETDPLTGLANRRRVMEKLDSMVINARVTQMPLVLVMFDIDHFKRVNDTHGHPVGDRVLHRVAKLAESQARENDLIGRVGGEEFVWIIPGASDGMAEAMTERLRRVIAENSAVAEVPPVTVSLGYTAIQAGDTGLSLFARADSALYEAKHGGRNQVRMAA